MAIGFLAELMIFEKRFFDFFFIAEFFLLKSFQRRLCRAFFCPNFRKIYSRARAHSRSKKPQSSTNTRLFASVAYKKIEIYHMIHIVSYIRYNIIYIHRGIPKIHLAGQSQIFCTLFAFWSIESHTNGIFVGIEITRLIFGRPQIFIKSYLQFYP